MRFRLSLFVLHDAVLRHEGTSILSPPLRLTVVAGDPPPVVPKTGLSPITVLPPVGPALGTGGPGATIPASFPPATGS